MIIVLSFALGWFVATRFPRYAADELPGLPPAASGINKLNLFNKSDPSNSQSALTDVVKATLPLKKVTSRLNENIHEMPLAKIREILRQRDELAEKEKIGVRFPQPQGDSERAIQVEILTRAIQPLWQQSTYWTANLTVELGHRSLPAILMFHYYNGDSDFVGGMMPQNPRDLCWILEGYFPEIEIHNYFSISSGLGYVRKNGEYFSVVAGLQSVHYEGVQKYIDQLVVDLPLDGHLDGGLEVMDSVSQRWLPQRTGVSWTASSKEESNQIQERHRRY